MKFILIGVFFLIVIILIKCRFMESNPIYKHRASDFFKDNELLVAEAIRQNSPQEIEAIVRRSTNVNLNKVGNNGMTLLFWACAHRYPNVVEKLLQLRADPNQLIDDGKTKAHLVAICAEGIVDKTFELLLEYGGNTNGEDKGTPALHKTVYARRYDRLKLLLRKGADINSIDKQTDNSLIEFCAALNQFEIVAYLIEQGADFKRKNKLGGSTALKVQENKGRVNEETEVWRAKVEQMLKDRGIVFPVERPWETRK
jgi:uncharacterized protein